MLGVLGNADPMGVDDDSDDELFKPASAFGEPGAQSQADGHYRGDLFPLRAEAVLVCCGGESRP